MPGSKNTHILCLFWTCVGGAVWAGGRPLHVTAAAHLCAWLHPSSARCADTLWSRTLRALLWDLVYGFVFHNLATVSRFNNTRAYVANEPSSLP